MLVLAVVALEIPLASSVGDRVDAEVRSQARGQADVVAASAADLLVPPRREELGELSRAAATSVRGRVVVVDSAGRLVADSEGGAPGTSYASRPEIAAALAGRTEQLERRSRTLSEDLLATAVPIVRNGRPAGAVRVTQSTAAVRRAVRRSWVGLALVGLLVLGLGLAAGWVIAGGVARPLRRLDEVARRVADGDLRMRARVDGSAEQRSLARTFNEMTTRLDALLRAQREFVADASHQLRTPLTGLRLRLDEARAASSQPEVRDDLDAGLREVDRLAQIVSELLELSRAAEREAPPESVDLADAARRAAGRWERQAAEGEHRIATDAASGTAWCPRADLDRVLDALVENALHYAPPGTTVTLAVRDGGVSVLDEGPGLTPGEEDAVFERFHRGSAGRRGPAGTGLGLAIARTLAGRWGGDVTLVNRDGGGAEARVRVPER